MIPVMVIQQVGGFAKVSRLYCDHWHVELWQLLSHDSGGTLQGVLSGAVHGQARVAVQASHAAHVNYATCGTYQCNDIYKYQ